MGLVVLTVCNLLVSWSQSTVTPQHMPCRRMTRERVKLSEKLRGLKKNRSFSHNYHTQVDLELKGGGSPG